MVIGLDYGGVVSFSPDEWGEAIRLGQVKGHTFLLISHAQKGHDAQLRIDWAAKFGVKDLTFTDLISVQEEEAIARRKMILCIDHKVDVFIDDDWGRCQAIVSQNHEIAVFYVHQSRWRIGLATIKGLVLEAPSGRW